MDDILYVLLIIGYFAFSVYQNIKKAKKDAENRQTGQKNMQPEGSETDPFLDEVEIEEMLKEQEKQEQKRLKEEQELARRMKEEKERIAVEEQRRELLRQKKIKETLQNSSRKNASFMSNTEGEATIANVNSTEQKKFEFEDVQEQSSIDFNWDDTDEVRRAFVYSEIFNRKY